MATATSSSHSLVSRRLKLTTIQSQPRRAHRLNVCCSSSPIDETLTQIHSSGVIACLRANSAEVAFEGACAALDGGISALEVIMTTPGVFEVLKQLVHIYPTRVLGVGTVLNIEDAERAVIAGAKFLLSPAIVKVGTVLNIEDAERAVIAGAKFLLSPAIVKDIMDSFPSGDVLYIPGVMTPTEILSASNAGARIVKIFPVSALGGANYVAAIKKPFSHISMVASQGVTIDSISDYIAKGASSVVLSDAIFEKEAMGERDFNKIRQLANIAVLRGKEAVDRKHGLMLNNTN